MSNFENMTENLPSLGDLLPKLLLAYDSEVVEYNAMSEELVIFETKNTYLSLENSELKKQIEQLNEDKVKLVESLEIIVQKVDTVKKNALDNVTALKQSKRESSQAKEKLEQAIITVASYKQMGSPKKIRDQLKSYKEKAAINVNSVSTLKNEVKGYKRNKDLLNAVVNDLQATIAQTNVQSIWSKGSEHLIVFPAPNSLAIKGTEENRITLLYMNESGCGKLITLDEQNEAVLSNMPKSGLKPKAATFAKAGSILRKFRSKNDKLTYGEITEIQNS
jgi:hypothetical protein